MSKFDKGVDVEGVLLITNTLEEDNKRVHKVDEEQR
jgi:hypothetical protein